MLKKKKLPVTLSTAKTKKMFSNVKIIDLGNAFIEYLC